MLSWTWLPLVLCWSCLRSAYVDFSGRLLLEGFRVLLFLVRQWIHVASVFFALPSQRRVLVVGDSLVVFCVACVMKNIFNAMRSQRRVLVAAVAALRDFAWLVPRRTVPVHRRCQGVYVSSLSVAVCGIMLRSTKNSSCSSQMPRSFSCPRCRWQFAGLCFVS